MNFVHMSLLSKPIENCCRYESFESEKNKIAANQNRTNEFSEDTLIRVVVLSGCDKNQSILLFHTVFLCVRNFAHFYGL